MPQFALRQRAANRDSHVRLHQGLHTHGDLCIRKVSSRLNSHIGSPMANVHRYPDNNAPRTAGEFRLQPLADRVLSRPVSASETLTHDGHRGRTRPLLPRVPEVRRRRAQGSPQQPRPDGQAGAHRGTGPSGQRVDPAGSQEALQRTGRSHRGHRKERLLGRRRVRGVPRPDLPLQLGIGHELQTSWPGHASMLSAESEPGPGEVNHGVAIPGHARKEVGRGRHEDHVVSVAADRWVIVDRIGLGRKVASEVSN